MEESYRRSVWEVVLMIKVDSKRTLRDVSKGLMRMNRGRNLIAFLAVILTAVMFTTLFTSVASMLKSQQRQEMREYYNTAHIGIQFTTREQFEQIIKEPMVKEYGYTIFMGLAENEELTDYTTEVKYADLKGGGEYDVRPDNRKHAGGLQ